MSRGSVSAEAGSSYELTLAVMPMQPKPWAETVSASAPLPSVRRRRAAIGLLVRDETAVTARSHFMASVTLRKMKILCF